MGNPPDRVEEIMAREGEVMHVPRGCGENFEQDPEVGIACVAHEGVTTKSGYLTFDTRGISTINWRPTGYQVSEYSI